MTQSNIADLKELGAQLADQRKDCVLSWEIAFDELNICVAPSNLHNFVSFLKTDANCQFSSLVDITAVDYPERSDRFDIVYHFLSMYQNKRIRLRVAVREDEMLPSICDIHPSANWFEREVFDMFGIIFENHPQLTRILMPDDWIGHPLRKDYGSGRIPVQFKNAPSVD